MTHLSTYIESEINRVLSENTRMNTKAQHEVAKQATHNIIQKMRNKVTPLGMKIAEAVEPLREVIK